MSRMIGDKVIGKVFDDNLEDFKEGKDMGPIADMCSIISKILVLVKELDSKQRHRIEGNVIHRSHILHILYAYLSGTFTVRSFPTKIISDSDSIVKYIDRDQELINIFSFIVSRRLVVIDDIEFQGKSKGQLEYPFLPYSEMPYVCWMLNNIAYRVFLSPNSMANFSADFCDNLKRALNQLYERDKRLKMNGENFWIIEKDIEDRTDALNGDQLLKNVSHTTLVHIPHTIPFSVRAKIL